jgi:uroporphyrinogen-III decarboxylase
MVPFFIDMVEIPDTLDAVMGEMAPHLAAPIIGPAVERGFPCIWVGGWRGAPFLMSPDTWNRFVWPYLRDLTLEVIDADLIPILHLDSDWTRELASFRELPRGTCILALDGETDIFKAKEVLGDHMCIMGDVPASTLYGGTPDEVHEYSSRLIRELGPEGFILQSGCDIPTNAKMENVKAMVAAALG